MFTPVRYVDNNFFAPRMPYQQNIVLIEVLVSLESVNFGTTHIYEYTNIKISYTQVKC